MWNIIKRDLRDNKWNMVFLLFLQIVASVLSIIVPYLNGAFLDLISISNDTNKLFRFICIFGIVGILSIVIAYFVNICKIKVKSKISYSLNYRVIKHLELTNFEEFEKYDKAYLNQRINLDSNSVVNFFVENAIIFFLNFLKFVCILFLIWKFNIIILFAVLSFIFIYILFYTILKKNIFKYNVILKESQSKFFSLLNKTIFMNQEIRTHSLYNESGKNLEDGFSHYYRSTMKYGRVSSFFSSCEGIVSLTFQIVILIIGGILIMQNKMSLGEYSIVNVYFTMIISIVGYYFNIGKSYQEVGVSVNRIMEILNMDEEKNGSESIDKIDTVNINDLVFAYSENNILINKLSYEFKKGNVYIIEGENGTGKSTLLSILIRLRCNLKNGSVLFNNQDFKNLDMHQIRKNNISVYLQNETVYDVTIRKYIFGDMQFDDKYIEDIVSSMKLEKFLISNSFNIVNILDRPVESLSAGERQKMFIFRTFLKDADIYILDEPTSSMDSESKMHLLDFISIFKKDKMVILITHDLDVKLIADENIDMNIN